MAIPSIPALGSVDWYAYAQGLDTEARTIAGKVGGDGSVLSVVKLTQAAYDGLGTKDAATLYVIQGP